VYRPQLSPRRPSCHCDWVRTTINYLFIR
jgi:hypothetical protein